MTDAGAADAVAAAWVARLDRCGTDERDHPELVAWLDADPRHRGAFVRARALWDLMDGVPHDTADAAPAEADAPVTRRRALAAGLAAAGVSVGLGATLFWPHAAVATPLRTGFGEIRRFPVGQGGTLVLDGDSAALLHPDARRIDLIGGALWIDLPGRGAPFALRSGGLELDAAAAALTLRRTPVPEAIVARGVVDLADGDRRPTQLGAGTRVRRDADAVTRIDQVPPATLDRLTAWRTGDVELDGETVAAAAARFNAYNRAAILVTDPALAAERVVGRFALHRPGDFAAAVAAMTAGRVTQDGATIRILSAREKALKAGG